ncbi:MAG: tetratricopeptide repeat protein [Candidatus Wenzhouxiangella sp. M2_3B_020]
MNRRRFAPAALLLAWLACPLAVVAQPESPSIDVVQRHLAAKEYDRALKASDELVEASEGRERARALNARGWTLFEKGDPAAADAAFEEALEMARAAGDRELEMRILNNMGINKYVAGELDGARRSFVAARDLGSRLSATYLPIIDSQQRQQQVRAYIRAGIDHRLNLRFDHAVEQYSRALELEPGNIDALSYRGYAHYRSGNHDEAFTDIEAALAIEPGRLDALINYLKTACAGKDTRRLSGFLEARKEPIRRLADTIEKDRELTVVCGRFGRQLAAHGIDF